MPFFVANMGQEWRRKSITLRVRTDPIVSQATQQDSGGVGTHGLIITSKMVGGSREGQMDGIEIERDESRKERRRRKDEGKGGERIFLTSVQTHLEAKKSARGSKRRKVNIPQRSNK